MTDQMLRNPHAALAPPRAPATGELVEPREAWLPLEARELFSARSRLLTRDPYMLHAPPNTERARRGDWALFCAFCEQRGVPAMPATPETVVAFLEAVRSSPPLPGGRPRQERISDASLARRARRVRAAAASPRAAFPGRPRAAKRSAKTLERYATTIGKAHRLAAFADPIRVERVRNALHALMDSLRAAQPRAPMRRAQVLEVIAGLYPMQATPSGAGRHASRSTSRAGRRGWRSAPLRAARLWDLRARALLACFYPTMARRSELLELRVEDLPRDLREGAVSIHSRKTQQREHRYLDALALESMRTWCAAAGITTGLIFRQLDWQGKVGPHVMSAGQILLVVRACWAHRAVQQRRGAASHTADAQILGEHLPDLGAHSLRIGAAHDLVASGQDLLAVMHSGGWRDPRMPRRYIQELKASDSGMARMLRAQAAEYPTEANIPATRSSRRAHRAPKRPKREEKRAGARVR